MNRLSLKDKFVFWGKGVYIKLFGEERWAVRRFIKTQGKRPNFSNPHTMNEKMAWLKINYSEPFHIKACDKYLVHDYLKDKLGKDYAPELFFVTQDPSELKIENIKKFPCIIKVSNGSGSNLIVNTPDQYTDEYLQAFFKDQIIVSNAHAVSSLEHQYLKKNPYIVVERLLSDGKGGIPNDYKFLYINGKLEFIYCSVDRLGANVRQVYDKNWKRLHFIWVAGADEKMFKYYESSESIEKPVGFDEMFRLSQKIAEDFPMVRVDFYEENENVYIGEITLHHGSAGDKFYPEKYDEYYGNKLVLPRANRKER